MNIAKFSTRIQTKKNSAPADAATAKNSPDSLWQQVLRFIFFGAFSTAIDFAVLNLCLYIFHIPSMFANIISLSISLVVSYSITEKFIFRGEHKHSRRRKVIYFVVMTLVGQYGIQSGLFALLTSDPLAQNAIASFLAPILGHLPFSVVAENVMKLFATLATGIWGFVLSRQLVFAYDRSQPSPVSQS